MKLVRVLVLLLLLGTFAGPLWANDAYLVTGVQKTLGAVISLPAGILGGMVHGGFPFGMIGGAVQGTFSAVGQALSGAYDLAVGGAPYAKYAALAL